MFRKYQKAEDYKVLTEEENQRISKSLEKLAELNKTDNESTDSSR